MNSKQFTLSPLVRLVSLALVIAALGVAFVGQAAATSSPNSPDLVERWVQSHPSYVLAPDDLDRVIQKPAASFYTPEGLYADGLRAQGIAEVYQRLQGRPASSFYTPQALKAAGMRLDAMAQVYKQPQSKTTSSGSGFDWSDGGIGAATGLALVLCSAGLILIARRNRDEHLAV